MLQKIIVHKPNCSVYKTDREGFHVAGTDLDQLEREIFELMQKHDIPFYKVEPHDQYFCPGYKFPWEELEMRLFILEH